MDQELQKDKEELHNDILVAALKLFTEKGYFNTSLTDIAEISGVKTSAGIYKHFKVSVYSPHLDKHPQLL
jgi:AcrR family transcriptional regulator